MTGGLRSENVEFTALVVKHIKFVEIPVQGHALILQLILTAKFNALKDAIVQMGRLWMITVNVYLLDNVNVSLMEWNSFQDIKRLERLLMVLKYGKCLIVKILHSFLPTKRVLMIFYIVPGPAFFFWNDYKSDENGLHLNESTTL